MKLEARRQPPPRQRKLEGSKNMSNATQDSSIALKLILAWGFVGIPLVWGVLQTLSNAMKLFQ